jgi:hypothetical protein
VANNTYRDGGVWNTALNALPKSERRLYKLTMIAALERQKIGTPSYNPFNVIIGNGTFSPIIHRPWSLGNQTTVTTNTFNDSVSSEPYTVNITNGDLVYNQTTGPSEPVNQVYLLDTTANIVYSLFFANGVLEYVQTDISSNNVGITLTDTVTSQAYLLYISNNQLMYSPT